MPKRPAIVSLADEQAAAGGVAAVDRALSLLGAFEQGTPAMTLAALARATRLYKSTILRLLASLEHGNLVLRQADGRYTLGPGVARLHSTYIKSPAYPAQVIPALHELVAATGESAAFHVRQGAQRLCLAKLDSPHPVRDHIQAGDLLPLDRGSGGRVLQAYGEEGDPALGLQIRADGVIALAGDREPEIAGIAAPVFGPSGHLLGALVLTMPRERLQPAWATVVRTTAQALSLRLGGAAHATPAASIAGPAPIRQEPARHESRTAPDYAGSPEHET